MPPTPFFSVVIPTYNRKRELERALDSLLSQSFKDFEVLVCDDGSTDGTREVCEKWAGALKISYLYNNNSGGPAKPRNNGMRHAKGEWVCFLDSDDWWYASKLERIRELSENADVIYHDCYSFTGPGRRKNMARGRSLQSPVFEDLMVGWNPLVNSATCIRKSILDASGGFDEDRQLIAVEDFDLWLRIARITERFVYVRERLGAYVLAGGNISHFCETSLARERAIFERHAPFLGEARQKAAMKMMSYRLGLIHWHLGQGRKSREMFLKALLPVRWRHRLFIAPWIVATFFCREK